MTLGEIKMFIKSVTKAKIAESIQFISQIALGSQGEGKSIKENVNRMSKLLNEI